MADIDYSIEDGVGTILLNRPSKRNAFTLEMVDQWASWLVEARNDSSVGSLLLTGAGGYFCSGGDLGDLFDEPATAYERKAQLHERVHRVALALYDLDKPVIAAMNGVAVGAGLDMALMCDIRLAAASARFSTGYVRVGVVPGDGGAYYLPRIVGIGKALELLLTGDFLDADEALRIGLVNRVCEDGSLQEEARALARRLAEGPQLTLRMIKRSVYQSSSVDLRTALDLASSHFAVLQSTTDAAEALAALHERRDPRYVGR